MKQNEATLLGYKVLYSRTGKLITERITTDITKLKEHFKPEDHVVLEVVMREGTTKLDSIHQDIENHLNARKMGE